jgi:two-component system, NarL family, sensor kinase
MGPDTPDRVDLERKLDDLMRQHHDLVDRLSQGQQYFRHLARSVWRVQEEERRRLARDLHDGIGQNLTALVHLLDHAFSAIPPTASEARTGLERARALVFTTLDETRALSRVLRPQILDDLGLEAALRWLTRTFTESHAFEARLNVAPATPTIDSDQATVIFRVVQEALTNAARHSKATQVVVELGLDDNELVVVNVRDNGCGCNLKEVTAKNSEGHSGGIGGMRDRVRLFGGDMRLDSKPGAGFCVTISFPVQASGAAA